LFHDILFTKERKMVANTQSLTATETAVLGKMLVEILSGNLTDDTLQEVRRLPKEAMPEPFRDLAKQAGGSATTGEPLVHAMLIELRGVCSELLDPNYPQA
jgi:hypothetical protein